MRRALVVGMVTRFLAAIPHIAGAHGGGLDRYGSVPSMLHQAGFMEGL